ncbi:hypothetical protein [Catenuloplanes indicus]|uniref:GNAT superfamily N-acetyltransferase n=1 Tax=Catenuloplanes indicus TaxID=137267 RepID=A0AAE3W3S3_9ACTN|nr:hypothetical protein [Catenuloplanes indicus]MDQ0368159.1 GNAT superfamily N-acetyltransferase [Catenuloplanes indicus]
MTGSVSTVASGLVGLAGTGGAAAIGLAMIRRPRPYLPGSHALLDPGRRDPLGDALRRGYGSASIPVQAGPDGRPLVRGRPVGRLLLRPLLDRARRRGGRVHHGPTPPFGLVLELAPAVPVRDLLGCLHEEVAAHPGLVTRAVDGRVVPGAVTVLVSGTPEVREVLAADPGRHLFADGTFDDLGAEEAPAALVPMVSEHWSWRFGWDGEEPIPAEERYLLHDLVRQAHEDGRRVRLFGVPHRTRRIRTACWAELAAAGVDLIGDANLPALARYLRTARRPKRPVVTPRST